MQRKLTKRKLPVNKKKIKFIQLLLYLVGQLIKAAYAECSDRSSWAEGAFERSEMYTMSSVR